MRFPHIETTLKLIKEAARAKGMAVQIDKVEDIKDIMSYGVVSTPGVVVDGTPLGPPAPYWQPG